MKLIYGTLGWHTEYLQPAIRTVEGIEGLVIYYGYEDKDKPRLKTIKTLDKMRNICRSFEIKPIPRKVNDIYDFINITKQMKSDIQKDITDGHEIAMFNIAGSTKPMVSAALLVCIFLGIPAQYINEETLETVKLPLLQANYLDSLTTKERELAEFIIKNRAKSYTQVQIAEKLGKKKSTINTQIKKLVDKGIVVLEPASDGKSKTVKPSEGIDLLF
jgi:CRISPR locus-related DNA-binding protein